MTFGMVFAVALSILAHTGFVPEAAQNTGANDIASLGTSVTHAESVPFQEVAAASLAFDAATTSAKAETPVSIDIPSLGIQAKVLNPASTDIKVLDTNLLSGAVHYPTSAVPGEDGNVIIFGHSSYQFPLLHNQAYRTFNDIDKLTAGDTIIVHSNDTAYIYMVASVEQQKADTAAAIPLQVASPRLTLVTCTSFGVKGDRIVVTAVLVDSRVLPAQAQ